MTGPVQAGGTIGERFGPVAGGPWVCIAASAGAIVLRAVDPVGDPDGQADEGGPRGNS